MKAWPQVIGVVLVAQVAAAGFVVESRRGQPNPVDPARVAWEPGTVTAYLDPATGKVAQEGMILDGKRGEITLVMDERQAYYRNTVQGFCGDMDALLQRMFATPEMQQLRAQMGAAGPGPTPPRVELRRAGAGEIAGYRADRYQLLEDGVPAGEQWYATDPRLAALDPAQAPGARDLVREFDACQARFAEITGEPAAAPGEEPDVSGYLLRDASPGGVEEVVAVREQPLDPAVFAPPAGYRAVSLEEVYGEGMAMGEEPDPGDAYGGAPPVAPPTPPPGEPEDGAGTAERLGRELSKGAGSLLKGLLGN